jgi:hypothetical protein
MNQRLLLVSTTAIVFSAAALANSPIISNPDNGHFYQRFDTEMSWHDAKAYCENLEGYLATLTSPQENKFVYDNLGSSSPSNWVWLGGTDEVTEGDWKWITGESWVYTNWYQGEPNNNGGNEHYLHTNTKGQDYWNDVSASWEGVPVCEWDKVESHLDHFQCYPVKGKKIKAKVDLLDQFGEQKGVKVVKPVMLCNPVIKWHNDEEFPVSTPDAHLVCYKINKPTAGKKVIVKNQFGDQQELKVSKSKYLCVPSEKFIVEDSQSDEQFDE